MLCIIRCLGKLITIEYYIYTYIHNNLPMNSPQGKVYIDSSVPVPASPTPVPAHK